LPSRNDTASNKAIVDFVELVTTPGSPGFIVSRLSVHRMMCGPRYLHRLH
jgi:hypothetical protein